MQFILERVILEFLESILKYNVTPCTSPQKPKMKGHLLALHDWSGCYKHCKQCYKHCKQCYKH